MKRTQLQHDPRHARGFTLVELLLSLAIVSVICVGIGSAVVLASKAIPTGRLPTDNATAACAALDRLQRDLALATGFTERTATAITFTVADRTGDNIAETIRYAWRDENQAAVAPGASGTLWRTINGVAAPVATNVSSFTLSYDTWADTKSTTSWSLVNSGEQELASFTGWPGISASSDGYVVSTTNWIGQSASITVPANATNLRVTRVKLKAKGAGLLGLLSGAVSVGIHGKQATDLEPIPNNSRIGTASTRATGLLALSYSWTDFTFSDVAFTTVPDTLFIVVRGTSGGGSGTIEFYNSSAGTNNGHIMRWNEDAGDPNDWSPGSGATYKYDTLFYLYGTYDELRPQTTVTTTTRLRSVDAAIRVGGAGEGGASADLRIQTLNTPQVTP